MYGKMKNEAVKFQWQWNKQKLMHYETNDVETSLLEFHF